MRNIKVIIVDPIILSITFQILFKYFCWCFMFWNQVFAVNIRINVYLDVCRLEDGCGISVPWRGVLLKLYSARMTSKITRPAYSRYNMINQPACQSLEICEKATNEHHITLFKPDKYAFSVQKNYWHFNTILVNFEKKVFWW